MLYHNLMWTQRLTQPIQLENGTVLLTLRDARKLILSLPEQMQHYAKWQRLAGSLLSAAERGGADIIAIATEQLRQALHTPPYPPVKLADHTARKPREA